VTDPTQDDLAFEPLLRHGEDSGTAQVRLLFAQTATGVAANLLVSAVLVLYLYASVPSTWLAGWYATLLVLNGLRMGLARRFQRVPAAAHRAYLYRNLYGGAMLLNGAAWGAGGIAFLSTVGTQDQLMVLLALGGMTVGAMPIMAAVLPAYLGFIAAMGLPVSLWLLSRGDPMLVTMGVMALVYLGVAAVAAERFQAAILTALRLRLANQELVACLRTAQRETERANAELRAEIDERQRTQHTLQAYRDHLEELVSTRTADLSAANKELETFSYTVSHDLRAPLRGINGFAQILLEEHAGELSPGAADYLRRIRLASLRMGELIEDLLQLARISRSTLERHRVDLSALAGQCIAQLRMLDPERKVDVTVEAGLTACGDERLLHIALEHLLGNAWKFTAHQPQPRIEVGRARIEGGEALYVRDNGTGFDMSHAEHLFGAFRRLHNEGDFDGRGIGLATVKRIVERHGGRVWAEAEPARGAVLYFTLPRECEGE
jgi:signal transduction histidine kinase